ncbi:MAG: hypothetical protein AB4368_20145 [Xenococcaceae cyanobacterium]
MTQKFMAIVEIKNNLSNIQFKQILQAQQLKEAELSKDKIKVLIFEGSESELFFKKNWFQSKEICQYLTLIDIGLAPNFEVKYKSKQIYSYK